MSQSMHDPSWRHLPFAQVQHSQLSRSRDGHSWPQSAERLAGRLLQKMVGAAVGSDVDGDRVGSEVVGAGVGNRVGSEVDGSEVDGDSVGLCEHELQVSRQLA